MPFYEYECATCKFYTEVMQKISDAPLKKCPSCGKSTLKKLVSAPIFRLKGSGWYETDFKSDKEARRNLLAAESEGAKESKPAESKPAESTAGESKPAAEKAVSPTSSEPKPKASSKPVRRAATPARRPAAARPVKARSAGAARRKARR